MELLNEMKMGLKSKFLLVLLLTIPVIFLFYADKMIKSCFEISEKALYANSETLVNLTANQLAPYILAQDKEKMVDVISLLGREKSFVKAVLHDEEGRILAEYTSSRSEDDEEMNAKRMRDLFAVEFAIFANEKAKIQRLGMFKVTFTRAYLNNEFQAHWVWTIITTALMISVLIFSTLFLFRIAVIAPFNKLRQAVIRAAEGDLDTPIKEPSVGEIGLLAKEVEKLRVSLKGVIEQLSQAARQTTSVYTEIQIASKQQEAAVIEQEAATKEIAVTIKEISSTTRDLAYTMEEVNMNAEEASALAAAGNEGLNEMLTIMQKMVESSNSTASNLAILNDKASNIKSVIVTISKVADQTNLLSLNSAIEAEIAGEHGRKFAVIAREIRRLADQTAYASLDISNIVNEMTSAVSSNVKIVDQFSKEIRASANQLTQIINEQLAKIIDKVQQQKVSIENVTEGMQSQLQAAEQIAGAVVEWSESAKETRNAISKFKKTIDLLWSSTQQLQGFISKFKRGS